LDRSGFSPLLSSQLVWLSGLLPFAQASAVLGCIGQYDVPPTTLWEQTRRQGQRLQDYMVWHRKQVGLERIQWQHERYNPRVRKSISLDGGMVYVRGEGWKELKAGVVSDIVPVAAVPSSTQPADPAYALVDLGYAAVVGDVEQFHDILWALAVHHEVLYAGYSAVTADGAAWIWRLAVDLFPHSAQIVDWYHANEHLALAAQALYPNDPETATAWHHKMQTPLFQGEIHTITSALEQAGLTDQAHYFHSHRRRMQYQTFRSEGYPIGSGAVESGIKQYKARLTGPGMRWSRPGVDRMVVIRSAVLSHSWDALWAAA
jgi:hypothetical protein